MSDSKIRQKIYSETKNKKNDVQINDDLPSENLNAEQINLIHEVFNSLDTKCSGELDGKQCIYLFRLLSIPIDNEKDFDLIMNKVDLDNNGKISFKEFLILLQQKMNEINKTNLICETFKYFDKDNDGFINQKDLSKIFLHLGEKINQQQLNDMLLNIDYDQDGFVNFQDFNLMINHLKHFY